MICPLAAAAFLTFCAHLASASLGDRLIIYDNHLKECIRRNCSSPESLARFSQRQPPYLSLFGWDCKAECRIQSQWATLERLLSPSAKAEVAAKLPQGVPQFYGKWTFYRLGGIQEPASFVFSILNFASNLYAWRRYHEVAANGGDPLYSVWRLQAFTTLNAWFWSTVYHARDTPLSEKLDYYSAFSVVLFSLCAVLLKLLSDYESKSLQVLSRSVIVPFFVAFFAYHIYYLHAVHFDYGYNMKVNVATGLLSTFVWFFWCFKHRHTRPHVSLCVLCLLCVNLCLLFELIDFPPFLFIFDAHSLWHLCTFPLPLLWFKFLSREAIYLTNASQEKKVEPTVLLNKNEKKTL